MVSHSSIFLLKWIALYFELTLTYCPYQKETMGMVWQSLGHTWPICGNGMGRPSHDMELMWGLNLAICMLWEIYGKNS